MKPEEFVASPIWFSFIEEVFGTPIPRHLPSHEDCSHLNVDDVQGHLRLGGTLGSMSGYEERPGQIDMTGAIANAFNERQHLMIEAGTGVGKSLAYLVPAVLWSCANDTPVVISTATRNLQSQLISSDIPRAVTILGDGAKDFKVALLKGRTNYLCLKAVDEYFAAGYWTLPSDEQAALPGFIDFLHRTKDGDLDDYDGLPRQHLTRPGDECLGAKCPFRSRCFIYKARRRAAEAHIIVANHSLVLAEATSSVGGILPAYGRLILDEAHNLENIATDYLSAEFSMPALNRIVKRLLKHHKQCAPKAAAVLGTAEDFIKFLGKFLPPKKELRRFDAARSYFEDVGRLKALQNAFEQQLIALIHYLHDFCDTSEDIDLVTKLASDAKQLLQFANAAAFVVAGDKSSHVYWIERVRLDRAHSHIRLVAAPISVADDLAKLFYCVKDTVILCSATLRVGNDFKYMAKRLGFMPYADLGPERFCTATATSPFDYFTQAGVLAPDCLPDPSAEPEKYAEALGKLLKDLFEITNGRSLVLFTSYEMMNDVAARIHPELDAANISLLVQGEGMSREQMTRSLKTAKSNRVVLFGAQSFWEGVDVAGEALSCVVLARLPFAMVGDPIIEARSEAIERNGGSAFRDYALPEAVIKFRQGFGRLIRSKSDHGVVIVTDPRLVTKNYGATFRKSIPATVHTVTGIEELLSRTAEYF